MLGIRENLAKNTLMLNTEIVFLEKIVSEWGIFADISSSDLTLWVFADNKSDNPGGIVCVDQKRPENVKTNLLYDLVGTFLDNSDANSVYDYLAKKNKKLFRFKFANPILLNTVIPIVFNKKTIAIIIRTFEKQNLPSNQFEKDKIEFINIIEHMISNENENLFNQKSLNIRSLKNRDGLIFLYDDFKIKSISLNGKYLLNRLGWESSFKRKKLISVIEFLEKNNINLNQTIFSINSAMQKYSLVSFIVENHNGIVLFTLIPLPSFKNIFSGIVFIKDLSEKYDQEKIINNKNSSLSEMHHRIKNSLQGITSIIRMQIRRIDNEEAKIILNETIGRIEAVSIVNSLLASSKNEIINLDHLIKQIILELKKIYSDKNIEIIFKDKIGEYYSAEVLAIAQIIVELMQNSFIHAFKKNKKGKIEIISKRTSRELLVSIKDNGEKGLKPENLYSKNSIGLKIVNELVTNGLKGELVINETRVGNSVSFVIPLDGKRKIINIDGS